ncbi:SPOR domain-containing protein [uncultured Endozoicomonas sp.]|uniref:SPOR domain-containing protein n=1 Tax=uncultured Endozoicomonas sp. TaxID=432652 RepID=UPI00261CDF54|nr:SPOR domain-containing protein [uncultured Endozoicomonas sp.]
MTTKSNSNKRGASRARSGGKTSKTPLPGWLWLLAGLLIGVFVAFLAGLTPSAKDVRSVADQVASAPEAGEKKENQPVFDFYTLLPESEVAVPAVTPEPVRKSVEQKASKPKATAEAPKPTQSAKYLLQAGSFRNISDAERLRARLLLEGLSPKIEKVNVGGGETWHRVQIGPFSDSASLKNAQTVLSSHNIDSLLLQLK